MNLMVDLKGDGDEDLSFSLEEPMLLITPQFRERKGREGERENIRFL